jgi:hypothetical protein
MRGDDFETGSMFSYRSLEDRIPADHPLRPVRAMVDKALQDLNPRFRSLYAKAGRPSIRRVCCRRSTSRWTGR